MMSLLQELVNEYLEAAVAFGQVFLVSGLIVALGYWLKLRIFGSPPPKQKRLTANRPPTAPNAQSNRRRALWSKLRRGKKAFRFRSRRSRPRLLYLRGDGFIRLSPIPSALPLTFSKPLVAESA